MLHARLSQMGGLSPVKPQGTIYIMAAVNFDAFEDIGSPEIFDAGAVHILYGTSTGVTGFGSDFIHQDSPSIGSTAEDQDYFGWALATGNFNGLFGWQF